MSSRTQEDKAKKNFMNIFNKLQRKSNYKSAAAIQGRETPIDYVKQFDTLKGLMLSVKNENRTNEMKTAGPILTKYSDIQSEIPKKIEHTEGLIRKNQNLLLEEKNSLNRILHQRRQYEINRGNIPQGLNSNFLIDLANIYNAKTQAQEPVYAPAINENTVRGYTVPDGNNSTLETIFSRAYIDNVNNFIGNYNDYHNNLACGPEKTGIVFDENNNRLRGEKYNGIIENSSENIQKRNNNLALLLRFWRCYIMRIKTAQAYIQAGQQNDPSSARQPRGGHILAIQYCRAMLIHLLNYISRDNKNPFTAQINNEFVNNVYNEAQAKFGEAYAKERIGSVKEKHESFSNDEIFDGRIQIGVKLGTGSTAVVKTIEEMNELTRDYETLLDAQVLENPEFLEKVLNLMKYQTSEPHIISQIKVQRRIAIGTKEDLLREILFQIQRTAPGKTSLTDFLESFFPILANFYINIYFINEGYKPSTIFGVNGEYTNFRDQLIQGIGKSLMNYYTNNNSSSPANPPFTGQILKILKLRFTEQLPIDASLKATQSAPVPRLVSHNSELKRYIVSAPSLLFSSIPRATLNISRSQAGGKRTRHHRKKRYLSTRKRRI